LNIKRFILNYNIMYIYKMYSIKNEIIKERNKQRYLKKILDPENQILKAQNQNIKYMNKILNNIEKINKLKNIVI
jgi:hypothetical protein